MADSSHSSGRSSWMSISGSATSPYTSGSTSVSDTSAMPIGLRSRVPAKMTSCMLTPRSDRADCSPSTHEMASEMFDLPQPLGPTMAAMPSPWKRRSVRSQNDLKPRICSFFSLSNVYSGERPSAGKAPRSNQLYCRNREGSRHKPHILCPDREYHIILHRACSNCASFRCLTTE